MPRLEGLTHSPPLHATHLTETVSRPCMLSFVRPLSTANKMADRRNALAQVKFLLSLIPLAASFQCIVMLFCTLLIQRKKIHFIQFMFSRFISASRDSLARTVYICMANSCPA